MNVLSFQKKNDLLALLRAGFSYREIGKRLKIHRETVSRYAKAHGPIANSEGSNPKPATGDGVATGDPKKKEGSLSQSACEVHREWIEEQVGLGRNGVSIYQDLVELYGFEHKYNSVKRFVRKLKVKDPAQYDRLEFLPGEEAQVDYGQGAPTLHPETGKYRKPRLFVMTLRYSRRAFRKVVWKSSQEVWAKLHEEAFRYFGGCPQYVVLDNLKEGVLKPDLYEPELNPVYSAMLDHYGVVADPARVRDPDRKGSVENAIQHTQDTGLKGRRFKTIEAQNEWLQHWEEKWAAQRIHGRTKRQVEIMFQEEKPSLKALPLTACRYFKQEVRTVWDDGCIQVGNAYYAALPAPLYSKVMVRIYDLEIEIMDPKTMEVLRRHTRSYHPGAVKMEEEDRIFNPSRQTEHFLNQAERIGPNTKALCETLFKEEGRPGQRRMRGIVSLARRHEAAYIEQAAGLALERGIRSSKSVRKIVEGLAQKKKQETKGNSKTLTQDHPLIRPPKEYGAFWEQYSLMETLPDEGINEKREKPLLH